jgi:CRP/FNR family cyclic AMP-dependent transcriptional regulator
MAHRPSRNRDRDLSPILRKINFHEKQPRNVTAWVMEFCVEGRELLASDTSGWADYGFDYQGFLASNPGGGSIADYASDQVIFAQGDPADALYYLIAGTARASVVSEQGREGIVAMLGPGSFFGEGCLDGRPTRFATVTTTSPCKVVRLRPQAVKQALASDPAFTRVFLKFILGRAEKLKVDLINQLFDSSEKRLARILLTLANTGRDAESNLIAFPINQEMLAKMVGTTRSRINQFMNKFRKLGYVEYNGQIRVYNSLLNVILSDQVSDSER